MSGDRPKRRKSCCPPAFTSRRQRNFDGSSSISRRSFTVNDAWAAGKIVARTQRRRYATRIRATRAARARVYSRESSQDPLDLWDTCKRVKIVLIYGTFQRSRRASEDGTVDVYTRLRTRSQLSSNKTRLGHEISRNSSR